MTYLTLEYIKNITGEFDEASVFQVILPNKQIPRIDAVNRCCNLRWLDLSNNQIIRMENLDGLTQLVSLDLSFNKIQKVANLEGMQSLERLKLKANPISRLQDLEGLRPARKLKHLHLRNIDNSDFCPVCLQDDYARTVRSICPELSALDSRRGHLPDLDEEVRKADELKNLELPEPEPWFTAGDLALEGVQDPDAIAAAMQPRLDEFEAALGDCQAALKEAEELLRLQELAPQAE